MLLSLMIVCAVGAALLFFLGAFDELRDIWTHPDHKDVDDLLHHPKPKGQMLPATLSSIQSRERREMPRGELVPTFLASGTLRKAPVV